MGRSAQVRRALVVEDEVMIAMYVEDLLLELGYEVAGIATGFDQALRWRRRVTSTLRSWTSTLMVG